MNVDQLAEVCWQLYDSGRPSATNQTLEEDDFIEMVYMETAFQLKMRYYQSRKDGEGEKTDFIAGMLSTRDYDLTDANYQGRRSTIVTGKEEVMRLPRNSDIPNVNMISDGCGYIVNGQLTQVQPGEENFYIGDNNLKDFLFFVQKGDHIDTYNVPVCVNKVQVERIFTNDQLDIPLDIAYEVATNILGVTLKVRGFIPTEDNSSDGNRNQLRYQLEQQDKKGV